MDRRESSIERLLHGIEDRIEEWRGRMSAREMELQAHREMLLTEAAERERLLAEATGENVDRNFSLEEASKEQRVAFIVHSEDAGKALEKFASEGARLVSVVPGSRNEDSGADIRGSWLVFEQEPEN
ncbi:MAG: hypothetical protein H0V83_14035 [Rubrobacter sp.]|nr:hypothetical protein [Rubrobacter sp.]